MLLRNLKDAAGHFPCSNVYDLLVGKSLTLFGSDFNFSSSTQKKGFYIFIALNYC